MTVSTIHDLVTARERLSTSSGRSSTDADSVTRSGALPVRNRDWARFVTDSIIVLITPAALEGMRLSGAGLLQEHKRSRCRPRYHSDAAQLAAPLPEGLLKLGLIAFEGGLW